MIGSMSAFGSQPARSVVPPLIVLVVLIFAGRACHSYFVTGAIYDEPHHIAAGMEWLVNGVYKYEAKHPPIARVLFALPLYLKGIRSQGLAIPPDEGNAILKSNGEYRQNLFLARLGNIPFLLITVWAIFLWSARWFSRPTALVALFLLLNLPPVIGHFSVATTDFSQAATLLLAGYAILRWSEDRTARSAILLGLAISLAILCKLSNIFFVLLILLVVLGLRWWQQKSPPLALRQISRDTLIILVIVMVAICVAYRFYSPPLSVKQGHHPLLDQRIPPGSILSRIAYLAVETPSPFNSFISGINEVRSHNRKGHLSYLLGEVRMDGWWYFFPVVLLFKTPLAILVLFLLFLFTLFKNRRTTQPDGRLTLLAISTSILLFSMTSNINAGVRHILSVYFFLALVLSDFIVTQFRMKSHLRPLFVILLLLFGYESLEAGSDHIGYFNRLAGSTPERILDESDLDWGQGINQLSQYLGEKGVSKVSLVYFGTAPLDQVGLPLLEPARIEEGKTRGYVAVSTHYLAVPYSEYQWLNRYQPIHRIGNTFNIYFFE